MLREQLELESVKGVVDVGYLDPNFVDVSLDITPEYAAWLKARGSNGDVEIMQPEGHQAWASCAEAKYAVSDYVRCGIKLVELLIEAGVPKQVAHQLLPHELYCQLHKE